MADDNLRGNANYDRLEEFYIVRFLIISACERRNNPFPILIKGIIGRGIFCMELVGRKRAVLPAQFLRLCPGPEPQKQYGPKGDQGRKVCLFRVTHQVVP